MHNSPLSVDDQKFLTFLRNVCEFYTGRIDLAEYSSRQDEWEEQGADGGFALTQKLDALRHSLVNEFDPEKRKTIINELRETVTRIENSSSEPKIFKLQAKLSLLHAEGIQLAERFLHELFRSEIRHKLKVLPNTEELKQLLVSEWGSWENQLNSILEEARAKNHPLLINFALDTRGNIRSILCSNLWLFCKFVGCPWDESEVILHEAMKDAEEAMGLSNQFGNLEGELRARMLLADLFLLRDQQAVAQGLAKDILPKAEAMGYEALTERAKQHISGDTFLHRLEVRMEELKTRDQDIIYDEWTENDIRKFAMNVLAELNLPTDRLPIVERDVKSMQDIARERLHWCRHIELIQSLRHTEHPSTHYLKDPNRFCICMKFNYETAVGDPDWIAVISAFKQTYCNTCSSQAPKSL